MPYNERVLSHKPVSQDDSQLLKIMNAIKYLASYMTIKLIILNGTHGYRVAHRHTDKHNYYYVIQ